MTVRDPVTLTCQEVVELVTEFLSETLSAEDRVRLEQHLLVCPPCTLHVAQVRSTIGLLAQLRTPAASDESEAVVLELFRHWKRG